MRSARRQACAWSSVSPTSTRTRSVSDDVSAPAPFAAPWTLENALRKADGLLYEVACHEGNYGLPGILSGARADEQRQSAAVSRPLDISQDRDRHECAARPCSA